MSFGVWTIASFFGSIHSPQQLTTTPTWVTCFKVVKRIISFVNIFFNLSLDIDECDALACSNEATCINTVGSYMCKCRPGFKGKTCCSGNLAVSYYYREIGTVKKKDTEFIFHA